MYPKSGESLVDLREFPKLSGVAEVIYNPCRTALLQQAQQLGLSYAVGFPMLVAQAKQAEELFFDREISAEKMAEVGARLQRDCENIVLIGMPGSGKTTIGQRLAEMTGRTLMDTDAVIEKRAGCTVSELFAEKGEEYFRDLERKVSEELGKAEGAVIACGGGLPLQENCMAALKQYGVVIWLRRDPGETYDGLDISGRPLAQQGREAFLERFARREPVYRRWADIIVEEFSSPEKTLEAVLEALK
jgi:shikimate kinase